MMETAPTVLGGGGGGGGGGGSGLGYADSVDSSPRSRGGDSWDDTPFHSGAAPGRLRLMCSYGGRIVPRPTDKSLSYLGGETRMVVVDRLSSLADLTAKLSRTLLGGHPFTLKYQLPNEDLDSLITVATDEDLENMIDEYDRIITSTSAGSGGGSTRSSRLRLFLFPSKMESSPTSSIGSLLDDSKSETWFVDALNSAMGGMGIEGIPRGSSDSASVNCLLGLEDHSSVNIRDGGDAIAISGAGRVETHLERAEQLVPRPDSSSKLARQGQDAQSVPDSPMLDTTSSFGSASSVPSLSNLPPICVRPDDRPSDPRIVGLNDHFAHMNLTSGAAAGGQRMDEDFKGPPYAAKLQSPAPVPLSASSASTLITSPPETKARGFSSDDDKSDHGSTRKLQQLPPKGDQIEAPIPGSGSRTMCINASSDPTREFSISSDSSYRVLVPSTDSAGYQLTSMLPEQYQEQQLHHQLLHHQQQQQQQQSYMAANPQYMHPPPAGVFPVPSYLPVAAAHTIQQSPQTGPYDPQIPLYYYPVRPNPSYNFPALQPSLGDPNLLSSAAKPTMPVARVPVKPELPTSLYRTAAPTSAAALQSPLIHVAADQTHPYRMGYPMVQQHHLSQSPAAMANYGYEFAADHTRPQVYYSQGAPLPATAAPRQFVSSGTPAEAKAMGNS